MMARQNASSWPVRNAETLADLHDEDPATHGWSKHSRPQQEAKAASRWDPNSGLHPLRRLNPSQITLVNQVDHVLRYRIEGRHRLRVRLERPLRHNQIGKLG